MQPFKATLWILTLICLLTIATAWADPSAPGGSRQTMQEQGTGWLRGHTSVSDLTWEQKLNRLGWYPDTNPERYPRFVPMRDASELPEHLDWRENGGDFITPVRDQGDCGSCFAFSGVGAIEGMWAIKKGWNNPQFDLSEQFTLSCASMLACDGGWAWEIMQAARDTGIPDENCFDYRASDSSCSQACDDWPLRTAGIDHYQLVLDDEADTEEEYQLLMQALQEGPLAVAFDVYEDFFDYDFGVYSGGGMYMGGHAIVLIGYDSKDKYWICKNSWGSGWGESGYFRIRWGESGFGREAMLPVAPACTETQINILPVVPGDNFFRYNDNDLLVVVRIADDCLRGMNNTAVNASVLGVTVDLFDDGAHNDEGANDGIYGGMVPKGLLELRDNVEIAINATAAGYTDGSLTLRGEIKKPADILIIDDGGDRDSMQYYQAIFNELGYSYDVWDVTSQRGFPFAVMQQAPAIFWALGSSLGTFKDNEEAAMTQYLEGGGNLLVSSQDLLMYVYDYRRSWTRKWLKVDKYWNDINYTQVQGIPEDFLTDGMGLHELNFPFTNYSDVIAPMSDATMIFRNTNNKATGLRYPAGYDDESDYRVVLTGFTLQALPVKKTQTFMQRTFDWFFHNVCLDTDGDGYGIGGLCEGERDCANDYADSYPGAVEVCDDGRDNDCNGLTDLDDPACEGFGEDDDTSVDDDDDTATDDDTVTDDDVDTDDDNVDTGDDDDDDDDDGCGC